MTDRELLELAWGVIANAGGGDWTRETPYWRTAAARWRDDYFAHISEGTQVLWPVGIVVAQS